MGLTDILTEIDCRTWGKFEKVTQYAHKRLGWDKFDLESLASRGAHISMVGSSVYSAISGFLNENLVVFAIGGALSLCFGYQDRRQQKKIRARQEAEYEFLKGYGTSVPAPKFSPLRPLFWLFPAYFLGMGIYQGHYLPTEVLLKSMPNISPQDNRVLAQLAYDTLAGYFALDICCDYFSKQLPTPPKKKRKLLRQLYHAVVQKLKPKEPLVPAEEKAGTPLSYRLPGTN